VPSGSLFLHSFDSKFRNRNTSFRRSPGSSALSLMGSSSPLSMRRRQYEMVGSASPVQGPLKICVRSTLRTMLVVSKNTISFCGRALQLLVGWLPQLLLEKPPLIPACESVVRCGLFLAPFLRGVGLLWPVPALRQRWRPTRWPKPTRPTRSTTMRRVTTRQRQGAE
jgi:hypothetical protein